MLYESLSKNVLDAVYAVHRELGPGLLEQCYHNALYYELKSLGLQVVYNHPFAVLYLGQVVGEYLADLVVDNNIIIEAKSVKALSNDHVAQLLNYLHISGCRLGYLVNFRNTRVEFKRLVL